MTIRRLVLLISVIIGCERPIAPVKYQAPLFDNLGSFHFPISTAEPMAQRFFDQGMTLYYGFNHAEAARSFQEGARLDPNCAMCYWGASLSLGPNINAGMDPESAPEAWALLQKALTNKNNASPRERDYIDALSARYAQTAPEDRKPLDRAYANAMRELSRKHPEDLDAATLFAEAVMVTSPWNYWTRDGKPHEFTPELLEVLERALARKSDHLGAMHFYIHAVEAHHPDRGESYADALRNLVPGAGHLVHMPSHIYMRVGRYHDASISNEKAAEADDRYVAQCHAQGIYPLAYHPHNYHFLWASTTMEGRSKDALSAAKALVAHTKHELAPQPGYGTLQHYGVTPLYAMVRFGKWDEILAQPKPELPYPLGVWHYAQGIAHTARGNFDQANTHLSELRKTAVDPAVQSVTIWDINKVPDLLAIASEALAGELAAKQRQTEVAVRHLRKAVEKEDALNYDEPPPWHYPTRHSLGAVLLQAGRNREAEQVYRKDLEKFPHNGWSLYGLAQSLRAQRKSSEAEQIEREFREAWKHADIELTASRILR